MSNPQYIKLQIRRANESVWNPTDSTTVPKLDIGELALAMDSGQLRIGISSGQTFKEALPISFYPVEITDDNKDSTSEKNILYYSTNALKIGDGKTPIEELSSIINIGTQESDTSIKNLLWSKDGTTIRIGDGENEWQDCTQIKLSTSGETIESSYSIDSLS